MNRIDDLFARTRRKRRAALIPFLTSGDPDLATTAALVRAFVDRGADLVELGIPYSDPIADGPVISASYNRALVSGVKLHEILEMAAGLRAGEGAVSAPLVTMVSYSIVHRRGPAAYLDAARAAGLDGLIVPDLPVEEAADLLRLATERDLRLIQLITPTTPRDRAAAIARTTSGFIYYVSVAGITGERREFPPDLAENVAWLRSQTDLPVCIGFGISQPEHIRALAPLADGLIVGSAIVRRIADAEVLGVSSTGLVEELSAFVEALSQARDR
jgi:tryptophan synthase alpha chain